MTNFDEIREFVLSLKEIEIKGEKESVNIYAEEVLILKVKPSKAREIGKILIAEANRIEKVH